MRPYHGDSSTLQTIPIESSRETLDALSDEDIHAQLRCKSSDEPCRPHVLWFDECYDEDLYRFNSSLEATAAADLLVIVGTSGATNLPNQMVTMAAHRGIPFVDINPQENAFGEAASRLPHGLQLMGTAGTILPSLAQALIEN